jgi:hypothetical protein
MRAPGVAQMLCIIVEKWIAAKLFLSLVLRILKTSQKGCPGLTKIENGFIIRYA